jgi:hypothetical protein
VTASLFFAAFDLMNEVPEKCALCSAKPPVFSYEFRTYSADSQLKQAEGFCCAFCASQLLKRLERDECAEWAQEDAALKAQDFDVSDLHAYRLAGFRASN